MNNTTKVLGTIAIITLIYPTFWAIRTEYRAWKSEVTPGIMQYFQTSPLEWNGVAIDFAPESTYYINQGKTLYFFSWGIPRVQTFILIKKYDKMMSATDLRNWCEATEDCLLETYQPYDTTNTESVSFSRKSDNGTVLYTCYPESKIWLAVDKDASKQTYYASIIDSLHTELLKLDSDSKRQ